MSTIALRTGTLAGKTAIVTGASRGIGAAIAIRLAAEEANVTMIGRTATPHPKYPGTIHTAAARAEAAGGDILPKARPRPAQNRKRESFNTTKRTD
ncbi:SDR family NAD(P)-dependent oxidoreductase, partial [Nocardia abscessus]|uniref:SDR family NAD(P)-dependent oxidoreductase n=1 Tax=Nocardia abscessus TaxID=120957 RepID=UPI003CC7DB39